MRIVLSLGLAFVVLCAACGASTSPAASATPFRSPTASTTGAPSVTAPGAVTPAVSAPPVLRIALTDVRTGDPFTLGEFAGRTVIVQGMAVW